MDNQSNKPAALEYFNYIGLSPEAVKLIIATHWHDDHISGLASTLKSCRNAKFCCSSAFSSKEFLAAVAPYDMRLQFSGGSGVSELFEVLEELRTSGRTPAAAIADRRIVHIAASSLTLGYPCEIWTLSPCDAQIQAFHKEVGRLIPALRETKMRLPSQKTNLLSVVTLVQVGSFAALLGADLEETKNPNTGWTPIVRSTGRPNVKSQIFKVPHHGSRNGHCGDVWSSMLEPKPISIATPFSGGRKPLPSKEDKVRISKLSSDMFVTAPTESGRHRRLPRAVEKTIIEQNIELKAAEANTGRVRLRSGGTRVLNAWSVELDGLAYRVQ